MADRARTERVLGLLDAHATTSPQVALYLSVPPEPDTQGIAAALDQEILVPSFRDWAVTHEPQWARWRPGAALTSGWAGIPMPTSAPVDQDVLASVDVVIVSALLADRRGTRLGTGGGWFDRALPQFPADVLRVCLLNDDEIGDEVSAANHDIPVDVLVTASMVLWTDAGAARR